MSAHDQAVTRARNRSRFRSGMYLLPSLFTVGNIAAGYFSITQTIAAIGSNADSRMHLDWAAIAILFAIPFEALDGRIARIAESTKVLSEDIIPSGQPVRAVLEVVAGTAKKFGIAPGDKVGYPIFSAR